MKIDEIKVIVRLMAEYDLTEFKVEAEECNLCIRRASGQFPVIAPVAAAPQAAAVPAAPAAPAAPEPDSGSAPRTEIEIPSPLVGTFYRSAQRDGEPLIKEGDRVTPDTVIGIIEAMKVMNEIKAEKSGIVRSIPAENGQIVEYGQTLVILE